MLGPIFNREALTVPRRPQHYLSRAAFLGLLWILGITAWQATVGWNQSAGFHELGRFAPLLFRICGIVQLILLLFFAALSAAGTIAQEKDRRTFILLLLSDLSSFEIVAGKLIGSLLPILIFLGGAIPFLMMLTFLGGIAPYQVMQMAVVLGSTAVAAGATGTLVALWRDKTFPALALTVLLLVLYIVLARGLSFIDEESGPSWLDEARSMVDPFLALSSIQQPPDEHGLLIPPAYGYALVMGAISLLLLGWGIWKLRVWNPSGEPIMQREAPEEETDLADREKRRNIHAAPGAVREVGENPIYWREVETRAYGRRPLLVKFSYFVVIGLIIYAVVSPLFQSGRSAAPPAAYGLVSITILSLLLLAAQSATAITSERDLGSLDLLLVTDLTPREFIYGKLGGIAWNAKEYLLPPLLLAGFYAVLDFTRPGSHFLATTPANQPGLQTPMSFEAFACIVAIGIVLAVFTMVLGIHVSLRTPSSRLAILQTLSTIFFLSVGTLVCIYLIIINGQFEYQWTSFLVFTVAGVGGMVWVLNGSRPSEALVLAGCLAPFAVLYCVINVLIGKPGSPETADPLIPTLVIAAAFGFTIAAMLTPLISEFDIALGRTTGPGD